MMVLLYLMTQVFHSYTLYAIVLVTMVLVVYLDYEEKENLAFNFWL